MLQRLAILLLLVAHPAAAQDEEQGRDLMAEALRLFMQGLMAEMEPALDDLGGLLENLDAYHPPEVMPNGDILIRRKTPMERDLEEQLEEEGEIEL